ncbi:zinc-dependent peptidase [Marinigracilibium pacificum]|uniref:Zinc-dependent peptidase n=1 Tax=Marinigracilibium pacificum TaxID=2729599 RepID=A0A848IYX2_9BACT|nr:zinc-dependent peptidase [Marinigracilibium pacificum]NMM47490.1 zinc-dependent peptidase [Marinigracilibium pacificum]
MGEFIFYFFLIILFLVPIILTFQVVKAIVNYFIPEVSNAILFTYKLPKSHIKILESYFHYYNDLPSEQLKKQFRSRVQRFIELKSFIPRGGLNTVTDEMKVLIAASAIQMTFGYPSVYFKHFNKILIYPDDYYSTITGKYHKGEVNLRGLIVLSWKNFVEGYMHHNDGLNLGLHEMAHALKFENKIVNKEYNFIPELAIKKFKWIAMKEMVRLKDIKTHLFRDYAATDYHEFFAVSIENFFEKPQELYDFDPKLYYAIAEILNQDLLNKNFKIYQQLTSD